MAWVACWDTLEHCQPHLLAHAIVAVGVLMDDAIHVQVQAVELRDERPVLKVLVNERVALRQPSIELGNSHGVGRLETPVAGVVQGPPPSDDTAGSAQDQWENVGRECQAGKPRGAGITQCNNTKTEKREAHVNSSSLCGGQTPAACPPTSTNNAPCLLCKPPCSIQGHRDPTHVTGSSFVQSGAPPRTVQEGSARSFYHRHILYVFGHSRHLEPAPALPTT